MMAFAHAKEVHFRPHQCPSCMYFHASIKRCRGYQKNGLLAMFGQPSDLPCPKYRIADFEGFVKVVNEERKTAVFSLGELDDVLGGVPVFDVPDQALRERLRAHIDGPAVQFSVRNGEVVEVR